MTYHNIHGHYQFMPQKPVSSDFSRLRRLLVHTRVRIQRGQTFIGIVTTTMVVVGVWRSEFPPMQWWILALLIGSAYLFFAWLLGYIDDRLNMARMEQGWYSARNPQLADIKDALDEILERLKGMK